jgi:hypothetical protein
MTLILSGADGLSDVDGSAATPAIRGTDTNTGMFFPAADTIAFAEGGVEAMRLDSAGNVGIGTSSVFSGARLDIVGSGTQRLYIRETGSSVYGKMVASTTVVGIGSETNHPLLFNTNDVERVRIDTSGNVDFLGSSGSTTNRLRFTYNAGSGEATIGPNSTGGSTFLTLGTSNAGTYAERARITAAGEMYIAGTTDQGAYNLQCNGTGVWGAGAYVNGSDARIKEEVSSLSSGLDVVTKLNPVQFRYKSDWSKDTSLQPGFIAQELKIALADQPYVDGVVQEGPQYMSVAYQTLIPVLVKAIQELKAENDALKARVAALEVPK